MALFLFGGAALLLALVNTWDRRDSTVAFPNWGRILLTLGLLVAAVRLASTAWLTLFSDPGDRRLLRNAFYLSQLAKYIPGGVWQSISVVTLAPEAGVGTARALTAVGVFTLAGMISAAAIASPLGILIPELPTATRFAPILGLAAIPLLRRGWMEWLVHRVARSFPRFQPSGILPPQQSIIVCAFAAGTNMILQGTAFAVLLNATSPGAPTAGAVSAFALAWLVGFLAVPIPAGVGLREAVLVATLGVVVGGPAVLAAAVLHRLGAILSEAILIIVSRRPAWVLRRHPDLSDKDTG